MCGPPRHSSKRRAEEDLGSEQHVTKRLAQMRIGRESQEILQGAFTRYQDQLHLQPNIKSPPPTPNGHPIDDLMYVDDTKDKVYIHDLESEIAQIEAEEPKGLFLPDFDKKISAIPQQLLQNTTNNANTQMVLYQIPSSISVPEEQDHVRKAIIATRARAREKQAREAEESRKKQQECLQIEDHVDGLVRYRIGQEEYDPDAMDLG